MEKISRSPEETIAAARDFSKKIKPGTVVALSGDLGSGKTTFIKGLALGFGMKDGAKITSPTFALMHIYPSKPKVYHFDLYRLDSVKEVADMGFEEYISEPDVVSCVEWAEKAGELIPKDAVKINFTVLSSNERKIQFGK